MWGGRVKVENLTHEHRKSDLTHDRSRRLTSAARSSLTSRPPLSAAAPGQPSDSDTSHRAPVSLRLHKRTCNAHAATSVWASSSPSLQLFLRWQRWRTPHPLHPPCAVSCPRAEVQHGCLALPSVKSKGVVELCVSRGPTASASGAPIKQKKLARDEKNGVPPIQDTFTLIRFNLI